MTEQDLSIGTLRDAYQSGERTPSAVIETVLDRVEPDDRNVWISRVADERLRERGEILDEKLAAGPDFEAKPLFGIPFAVKDNIDAEELETTAACPAYAYEPDDDATVVERLREAGAILVGKTNMDQFATGLVGTRSPYGVCHNAIDEAYISGGSSAGSGVAVAAEQVSFALGTDTAGSGRVPAACNGIVGLKPSRGMLSNHGVVPACKTLDCVAVFAPTCRGALLVEQVAAGFDPADPYSRRETSTVDLSMPEPPESITVGVPRPDQLEFFGDSEASALFADAVDRIERTGATVERIDMQPFLDAGRLLYGGPWVAERLAAIRDLLATDPDALLPVTRSIITRGENFSAEDTFNAMYKLQRLRKEAMPTFDEVDFIATPTTGTIHTIEAVQADPVERNSELGEYTNFVNLLDLAAIAVPAGRRDSGLPFGITLFGQRFEDAQLAAVGEKLCEAADEPIGALARPYTQL